MTKQLRQDFQRFFKTSGYCIPPGKAVCALRSAKTLAQWRLAESAGLVRLRAEPEQENYFDVYGEPDDRKERESIVSFIDRWGCWCVFSEVNTGDEAMGNRWEIADSIGMCVYENPLDPFDNDNVIDLMDSALRRIPQPGNVDELCTSMES